MQLSAKGIAAFEALQEIYEKHNLDAKDGVCCAADFMVWACMVAFIRKEDCKKQMGMIFPTMLANVEANWDGLQARREVLAALDSGESGGRLQ